jgi:hypothetical protein
LRRADRPGSTSWPTRDNVSGRRKSTNVDSISGRGATRETSQAGVLSVLGERVTNKWEVAVRLVADRLVANQPALTTLPASKFQKVAADFP